MAAQPPTQPSAQVMHSAQKKQGCGTVAVLAISTLAFILGIIVGGALLVFVLKSNSALTADLGLAKTEVVEIEKVIEKSGTTSGTPEAYALVYPIEESFQITGPLKKNDIKKVFLSKRYNLQTCYSDVRKENPDIKGEMALQFTINGSKGIVSVAVERQSTVKNAALTKCVLDEVKSWKFKDKQKESTVVKIDILFLPFAGQPG